MKPALYLINGPLGAGKTTFLRYLLQTPEFKNARVIENEFASTSIDTQVLHSHAAEIRTIAGVCICCSSGEELVEALNGLKNSTQPVIIEATGVANSLKLIEKLAAANIFSDYNLAHGVFVLDAAETDAGVIKTHIAELRGADTVLISKADLVSPQQYAQLLQDLVGIGVTNVQKVVNGETNISVLAQPSGMLTYFADYEGEIVQHDTNVNYTVLQLSDWRVEPQAIESAWLKLQQKYNLRRMKGDFLAANGTWWHLEATPRQCKVTKSKQAAAQLVCIGGRARELTLAALKEAC